MKRILQMFIALSISAISFGQLQNANWCFGVNAQINFNTNPASPLLCSNGSYATNMYEQSASVSDDNGQILFHTNGSFILDRNNQIMPNSIGLYGGRDGLQQKVIIVPKPNHPNLFYVFMIASAYYYGSPPWTPNTEIGGFHYSIIDMNLNGGNGDIVAGFKNIALKNHNGVALDYPLDINLASTNPLFLSSETRMTSTKHAEGDKIWVSMVADYFINGTHDRHFYNYLVSEQGINQVQDGISPTPTVNQTLDPTNYYNFYYYTTGQIKISPNGQFLCDANNLVNLYSYNNLSGNISFNSTIYNLPNSGVAFGIDFSPNSQ